MSSQTPKPRSSAQNDADATVEADLAALDEAVTTVVRWPDKAFKAAQGTTAHRKTFLKVYARDLRRSFENSEDTALAIGSFKSRWNTLKNDIRPDIIATEENQGVVTKMEAALGGLSANCKSNNNKSPMLKRRAVGEPQMGPPTPSIPFSAGTSSSVGDAGSLPIDSLDSARKLYKAKDDSTVDSNVTSSLMGPPKIMEPNITLEWPMSMAEFRTLKELSDATAV
jgi:hypothetical protein